MFKVQDSPASRKFSKTSVVNLEDSPGYQKTGRSQRRRYSCSSHSEIPSPVIEEQEQEDEEREEDADEVKAQKSVAKKQQPHGHPGPRRQGDQRRRRGNRGENAPLLPLELTGTGGAGRGKSRRSGGRFRYYGTASGASNLPVTREVSSSSSDEGGNVNRQSPTGSPAAAEVAERWTRRQWQVLFGMLIATCSSSFAVCLFPPFFPRLAEEKNATATIYGFVIGTNCLTSFLVTPWIGKNSPKFGVKYSFVMGMFMGGFCCMLSGFLEFFPPGWKFVMTSVFIRIVHATGNALVITSTFTYSAVEFKKSVGTIFSFTRTAMNLAQLLGPLVGGGIYQCGGFYLPFISMGAMQAGMGLLSACVLPKISREPGADDASDNRRSEMAKKVTISNILKIPTIWFSFITFIVATVCNGFLSINLEPRVLRNHKLRPFVIGLLFGLKDGANSISSPIWGYLCDKNRKTTVKPYVILSALLVGISFILMGAGAVVGLDVGRSMPILVFALCLNGVGIGGEQVAGVVDALHEAVRVGYPDDPAMHGLIAGLWSSLSGAGRFVSRLGSGMLVECIGFHYTAAIVTTLQGLIAASTFAYFIFYECTLKRQPPVQWQDVTIIEGDGDNQDEIVMFTESGSPSESLMGKTVSIDVPATNNKSRSHQAVNRQYRAGRRGLADGGGPVTLPPRAASSLPPRHLAVVMEEESRAVDSRTPPQEIARASISSRGLIAQSLIQDFY